MKLFGAQRLAWKVREELEPYCAKIEVAGSIRRERPDVNDIDLVLIPKSLGDLHEILGRCRHKCTQINTKASQNIIFKWSNGFQLDLWIAHAGIEDLVSRTPSNWGAVLLCRTGSMVHNTQLCSIALAKGLKFRPYKGIVKCRGGGGLPISEEIIAAETEPSIYEAIGLRYREPKEREALS